ncbi:MAG: hypothetical protein RLZZ453_793 [Chlamydiota bacterium]|jgi:RHS repeat-associated protein
MHRILFFLFLPLLLFASSDPLLSQEEDPAVFEHVNVISGHMHLQFQDVAIPGAVPFSIQRGYSSTGALERTDQDVDIKLNEIAHEFMIQGGWSVLPHIHLFYGTNGEFFLVDKGGSMMTYKFQRKEGKIRFYKPEASAVQNLSNLNARFNPLNHELQYCDKKQEVVIRLADGGQRIYRRSKGESKKGNPTHYKLICEMDPDFYEIHYEYDKEERLRKIKHTAPCERKTFSTIDVEIVQKARHRKPYHFVFHTSTGQHIDYQALLCEERHYLKQVESNARPKEEVSYIPGRKGIGVRLKSFSLAGSPQIAVDYYEPCSKKEYRNWAKHPDRKSLEADRVHKVHALLGSDGGWVTVGEFFYHENYTDVRDSQRLLIRYHHDGKRLERIEYFDRDDQVAYTLRFFWEGPHLRAKAFINRQGQPIFSKVFTYNEAKDVIQETFFGNLTGDALVPFTLKEDGTIEGAESYSRFYEYDPVTHLHLKEQEELGLTYLYTYKPYTTLVTSKLTTDGTRILAREFFFYDPGDHLLMKEIIDDGTTPHADDLTGVTQRHVKEYKRDSGTGLPFEIKESNLQEGIYIQQRRTEYVYSSQNRIIRETVYNAEDAPCYTLSTTYDEMGHITSKTTPSGYTNRYMYGPQGELISSKEEGKLQELTSYNSAFLPLSRSQVEDTGNCRTTHFVYDPKGRILSQTDPDGHTTTQCYDAFGRCIQTTFPQGQSASFAYDDQGNLIATVSPEGHVTHTTYTSFRKPLTITEADGSTTIHRYTKNNLLKETILPDGTTIHYAYDAMHRKILETVISSDGDLLSSESWQYNAFHLLSHTNREGLTTYYSYNGHGQLIQETAEERITTYTYDALGHLTRKTEGDLSYVTLYDNASRLIQQYTEDALNHQEGMTTFFYDDEGRKIKAERITSAGIATDHFGYDGRNRLSSHLDPLLNRTQFIYREVDGVLQKTTIDPTSLCTIHTYDSLGHLVAQEKQDKQGHTVAFERYLYTPSGHRSARITTVFEGTLPLRTLTTCWEYDACGRVSQEKEHPDKTTRFSYTSTGQLCLKTLPSGTTLSYTYDGLGRLLEQKSSDDTIHYRYIYDRSSHPIQIDDLINHTSLYHTYNLFDELIEEINPYGLTTTWAYDNQGRITTLTLPDSSSIHYHYTAAHLTAIERNSYIHRYAFDPNGHIATETIPFGITHIERDLLERPIASLSPYLRQTATYSPAGLLTASTNSLIGNKQFSYDPLNQLTQENDITYSFDSVGNPTNYTCNSYNQIVATRDTTLTYDPQGNLQERTASATTYTYDALSRLTSIITPTQTTTYTYDALDRLIASNNTLYLYDGFHEIGTCTLDHDILELNVLGLKDTSIAIELDHTLYIPLHDFSGNIIALLNQDGTLYETYPTDAFGKSTLTTPSLNPWRFASKRFENDLIYFGKRFYDPSLARFLTPDPSGFTEGPNLYLFVRNNPINRLDLFGLDSEFTFRPPYQPPSPLQFGIEVPLHRIMTIPLNTRSQLIPGKGQNNHISDQFIIASKNLYKLKLSPEEHQKQAVNIFDHTYELIPKEGSFIGIVTFQNGMFNSYSDFLDSCDSIVKELPDDVLFVGKYNPSDRILHPFRVLKEIAHIETDVVHSTRQFLIACSDLLYNMNPKMKWVHFSHSEGGLICHNAIKGMTPEQKSKLNIIHSYSFGPAHPISEKHLGNAENFYSKKDYITKWSGKKCKDREQYKVTYLESQMHWTKRMLFVADHDFTGPTYKAKRNELIKEMKRDHEFCDWENSK